MNELNEKDWELINAYHDGELGDTERRALESRLSSDPLLEEALRDVSSVSASLGALRPSIQQIASLHPKAPANQNSRPARWLIGGAVAAAITLAVALGPKIFAEPSVFDIHAGFSAQSYGVDDGGLRSVAASDSVRVPDLFSANLTPVALRQVDEGSVAHYVGPNGCRLSYFRGSFGLDEQTPTGGNQVAIWSTSEEMRHMIVSSGMDEGKFDAIAAYLRFVTREGSSESVMASLSETARSARSCLS